MVELDASVLRVGRKFGDKNEVVIPSASPILLFRNEASALRVQTKQNYYPWRLVLWDPHSMELLRKQR